MSSKSHLKHLTVMSVPNSSSFDLIIVNNEQYVGLCFLARRYIQVADMKSSIAIPRFTSTKVSKCMLSRKYQDSIAVLRNFISYKELISTRRLLPFLRSKTSSSKRRLVEKKIDLTISTDCRTCLFFSTKRRTRRKVTSSKSQM